MPTPIDEFKTPNLKPLKKATKMLGGILKKGDTVIYESTVYPGCTQEVCVPILEKVATSGVEPEVTFLMVVNVFTLSPGTIRSGE